MAFVPALNFSITTHKRSISQKPIQFTPKASISRQRVRSNTRTNQSNIMKYAQASLDHLALDCEGSALSQVAFYSDVLGFEPMLVEEFKQGKVPFPSVRVNASTILDFFENKDEKEKDAGLKHANHFCFALPKSEFDELLTRLKQADVQVSDPPKLRSGARGNGWSVYIDDPEGNHIEFRWYE